MIVDIMRIDDFGRGITYVNDKICFVENALPKEKVLIEIQNEKKKYLEAKVIKVLEKSIKRIENKCPYYLECGGCCLRHLDYSNENSFKENKIKNLYKKFLKNKEVKIKNISFLDEQFYRNKIILHGKGLKLGLYKNESKDIVEIEDCLLVNDKINEIIKILKKINCGITKAVIKTSNNLEYSMVEIIGKVKNISLLEKQINVLILNNEVISKNETILTEIGEYKFLQSIDSFFQVNRFLTKVLYDEVREVIKQTKPKKVLDLYCGTGTIGIYVSSYCEEVIGIDYNSSNINDAFLNKDLNGCKNITFLNDKVENKVNLFKDVDTIIVDPPRAGLDKKTISYLKTLEVKNLIYVSCDPVTLMRDLVILSEVYEIEYIKPFNMFPRTYHVECVCVLNRR